MQTDDKNSVETTSPNAIEDLTVKEATTEKVKGGLISSFSFGVEREMKESGEKGGTA